MNTRAIQIAVVSTSFLAGVASAANDGDLWVMLVGPMCVAQDPAYGDTSLGKFFTRGNLSAFEEQPFAKCFKEGHWASKELCDELMGHKAGDLPNVQPIYERHRDEIRGMEAAFNYFNKYLVTDRAARSTLQCPASKQSGQK